MNHNLNERVARKVLGCDVGLSFSAGAPTCCCRGRIHAIDQQCSVLADFSGDPRWAYRVAETAHEKWGLVVGAHEGPRAICEAALGAAARAEAKPRTVYSPARFKRVIVEDTPFHYTGRVRGGMYEYEEEAK